LSLVAAGLHANAQGPKNLTSLPASAFEHVYRHVRHLQNVDSVAAASGRPSNLSAHYKNLAGLTQQEAAAMQSVGVAGGVDGVGCARQPSPGADPEVPRARPADPPARPEAARTASRTRGTAGRQKGGAGQASQQSEAGAGSGCLRAAGASLDRQLQSAENSSQPAFWRASSCKSGFWSVVETRA